MLPTYVSTRTQIETPLCGKMQNASFPEKLATLAGPKPDGCSAERLESQRFQDRRVSYIDSFCKCRSYFPAKICCCAVFTGH